MSEVSTGSGEADDIVTRLVILEDERAILRVLHRFTHCIDYGLNEEFVRLFTEDGVFEVTRHNGPTVRRAGREELARFIVDHTRAPQHFHKHLLLSPVVSISEDTAEVESYFALLDERHGGPYVKTFGRYRDTLVKAASGWRIRERRAEVEVRTPDFAGEAARVL